MLPILRLGTFAIVFGLGLLAAPIAGQSLHLKFHKPLGSKAALEMHYAFGGPQRHCSGGQVQHWVPGHFECVDQRAWVPGHCERVWVPAQYELAYDACGRPFRRLLCTGYWKTIEHPGHWKLQQVRQWIEGHWEGIQVRG
jgi:hypothetical protein